MATVIERDVHHGSGDTGASSMLVAVVAVAAIVILLGIVLYLFRSNGLNPAGSTTNPGTIDVNVEGTVPTPDTGAQGGTAY